MNKYVQVVSFIVKPLEEIVMEFFHSTLLLTLLFFAVNVNSQPQDNYIAWSIGSKEKVSYSTWFSETTPGNFRSVCEFKNSSTHTTKIFFIVPSLSLNASSVTSFSISTGEKQRFIIEWSLEKSGAPDLVNFKVRQSRNWSNAEIRKLLGEYPNSKNNVFEEHGRFYVWGYYNVACWLPQNIALFFKNRE
jgi:hypothetical protein